MTKSYAARIRSVRKRRGLSRQQAASAFGCSYSSWCHWEQGKSEPTGLYQEKMDRWLAPRDKEKDAAQVG